MKAEEIEKRVKAAREQIKGHRGALTSEEFLEGYRRMLENPDPVKREIKRQMDLLREVTTELDHLRKLTFWLDKHHPLIVFNLPKHLQPEYLKLVGKKA